MTADTSGYRYRIRLDRDTLIVDRICARQGAWLEDLPEAVVEQLDGHAGLLHAIVSWLTPNSVHIDNGFGRGSARLAPACARLGITVIQARPELPQGKGRVERMAAMGARGLR